MNIYIPQHLKKLGIFRDLCKMVEKYQELYEDPYNSFDDYQIYMKIDPVMRFIGYCIKEVPEGQDYQAVLNYLTRLFYSVRGTRKVFEYMEKYLGIEFIGDPIYTVSSISFTLSNNIVDSDIALFNKYLIEFLDNLIYYGKLNYYISGLELEVRDRLEFYCGVESITYKLYKDIEIT